MKTNIQTNTHTVNVERSLKFGDELGGHVLSGHIDVTATISKIEKTNENYKIYFKIDDGCDQNVNYMDYVVSKGYISVDGASLTLVDVDREQKMFSVCLIPETLVCMYVCMEGCMYVCIYG